METKKVSRTNTAATHFVRRASFASSVAALFLPMKVSELPVSALRPSSLPDWRRIIAVSTTQERSCRTKRMIVNVYIVNLQIRPRLRQAVRRNSVRENIFANSTNNVTTETLKFQALFCKKANYFVSPAEATLPARDCHVTALLAMTR